MFRKKPKTALVLAPHTDDGELGAGGLIARLVEQGTRVHYVAFSNAVQSLPAGFHPMTLRDELMSATRHLGISPQDVSLKDYPVRKFNFHRQDILEDMIVMRKDIDPDLVLVPSLSDVHQDHEVIAREGVRAFKNRTILGYELIWNCLTSENKLFVEIDESHVQSKCTALNEYKSQGTKNYMREDFIRSLASVKGMHIGVRYAEAFEVIRMIV